MQHVLIQAYPVEHGQVHSHEKSGRGEVNPLLEVGEHQVVETLHIVSVPALQDMKVLAVGINITSLFITLQNFGAFLYTYVSFSTLRSA